ncbi:MAG: NAD(P)(+) transhydrogenase (Re/Si-specific) subunit beta [Bacteroidales bacterium]|nr:MAG: NAD(P)(+) transhydrogenase (Re/Si-specific) subunit beta [Bacteroidales bacterium]
MDAFLLDYSLTRGEVILEFGYLIAAVCFIIGLKLLSNPVRARKGNTFAAGGMFLAVIVTIVFHKDSTGAGIASANSIIIVVTISLGIIAGGILARKVRMTEMPQLVSFFNATGGAASALVALIEYSNPANLSPLVTLLSLVIGSIAFSGSIIAYFKLDGKVGDISFSFMKYINSLFLLVILAFVMIMLTGDYGSGMDQILVYTLLFISLIYGVLFVIPIGGADMPVVISLLNSFTGIAAALAGFIYQNQAMILGGIFVGSAGTILTVLMCRAMNRSLLNVIMGAFGGTGQSGGNEPGAQIKEITASDAAVLLSYSGKVVIVPGYGLAVAQAQHECQEMVRLLEEKGIEVRYAIHPVAGRMPGHMNVLLAEAEVPYEKLVEMDTINPELKNTDVVVVIGANDVVNPAAEEDPSSPIFGMPIIRAHEARNIIVMKRGMGLGYAAIENSLFYHEKSRMFFGNARDSIRKLIVEIKVL